MCDRVQMMNIFFFSIKIVCVPWGIPNALVWIVVDGWRLGYHLSIFFLFFLFDEFLPHWNGSFCVKKKTLLFISLVYGSFSFCCEHNTCHKRTESSTKTPYNLHNTKPPYNLFSLSWNNSDVVKRCPHELN